MNTNNRDLDTNEKVRVANIMRERPTFPPVPHQSENSMTRDLRMWAIAMLSPKYAGGDGLIKDADAIVKFVLNGIKEKDEDHE